MQSNLDAMDEQIGKLWRDALKDAGIIGLVVKCGFPVRSRLISREWMFVEITKTQGDDWYGTLLNRPAYIRNIKHGDVVKIVGEIIFAEAPEWADPQLKQRWASSYATFQRLHSELLAKHGL